MRSEPTLVPLGSDIETFEIREAQNYYVVQHNDLAQKLWYGKGHENMALSLMEEKLFAYFISRLKPEAVEPEPMTIDIKIFCKVCGLSLKSNYVPQIKNVLLRMLGRNMFIRDPKTGSETTLSYLSNEGTRLDWKNGKYGTVTVKLHSGLTPYLTQLIGNYYQFSLNNILAMKSTYGIRLYKLLKSYFYQYQNVRFSIEDLRHHLGAATEGYEKFSNFKNKVLTPALKDINEYSDLYVKTELIKTGHTFTHIIFYMESLEKPRSLELSVELDRRLENIKKEIDPEQFVMAGYEGGLTE